MATALTFVGLRPSLSVEHRAKTTLAGRQHSSALGWERSQKRNARLGDRHVVNGIRRWLLGKKKDEATEEKFSNYVGFIPNGPTIKMDDIIEAQKMWGEAVVTIGKAGDEADALAEETARSAYAFDLGPIMFKPTLASEIPFRQDFEGTVSYFVGGNSRFPEDKGFAKKPWTNVRFVNDTVKIQGNFAIAMGHYYFTDVDGNDTKAEYTKGYVKTPDDRVLIFLQDSSLPYSPAS